MRLKFFRDWKRLRKKDWGRKIKNQGLRNNNWEKKIKKGRLRKKDWETNTAYAFEWADFAKGFV